jgi:hypothetical protein
MVIRRLGNHSFQYLHLHHKNAQQMRVEYLHLNPALLTLIRPHITLAPQQLRADATVAAALNAELQERVDTLAAERLQTDDRAARALREHDSAHKLAAAALQLKFAHAQVSSHDLCLKSLVFQPCGSFLFHLHTRANCLASTNAYPFGLTLHHRLHVSVDHHT